MVLSRYQGHNKLNRNDFLFAGKDVIQMCVFGISTHAIYNKFRFDVSTFLASGRYLILLWTVATYRLILSFFKLSFYERI